MENDEIRMANDVWTNVSAILGSEGLSFSAAERPKKTLGILVRNS